MVPIIMVGMKESGLKSLHVMSYVKDLLIIGRWTDGVNRWTTARWTWQINPLLGTTWPFAYFLQGRLGRAVIVTWAYWFVCLVIVAKHLWCEQPVNQVQLTSIFYVQNCVYSSSYGEFLQWINRRSAAFADSTRSDRDIFIPITIAVSYFSPMYWHC